MSWAVGRSSGAVGCPRQAYERQRQRVVVRVCVRLRQCVSVEFDRSWLARSCTPPTQAQDDFARRLAQETKALLAVEHEERVEKVAESLNCLWGVLTRHQNRIRTPTCLPYTTQLCQARRVAPPSPPTAGSGLVDPQERLERIAKHKQ